jgi:hypothetical protein
MKEKFRNLLTGALVLAVGVAMGSSALMFETEEATASTTRTYAVLLPMDQNLSNCANFTAAAYKGTVATGGNTGVATLEFEDCGGYADCTNSCDNFKMWDDTDTDGTWDSLEDGLDFVRHNAVEIETDRGVMRGPFGWIDDLPDHGDRATSVSDKGSCYIRPCSGLECGGSNGYYTVDHDQSSRCILCTPMCLAEGTFS